MFIQSLPSTVRDLPIGFNFHIAVGFLIWHHHVRFTCVITVGIWDPNIFRDITSFNGYGTVQLSSKTGVCPGLVEISVHHVLL